MRLYLNEYISEEVRKRLEKEFELTTDETICEALITRCLIIDKAFLDRAPCLKYIAIHGTGVDSVDIIEAKKRGIIVFNAPGMNVRSVAEANIGLAIAASRYFNQASMDVKNGVIDYKATLGNELFNKTVGFIGMGKIAIETAHILVNGFNCKAIGYNRSIRNNPLIEQKSIDEVLAESDYVFLSLALCDETKGIIDYKKLSKMKSSAYLINTARGGLINHDDLVKALNTKIIKGYAADVFEDEPVNPNDELVSLALISTSHIGGNTIECLNRVGGLILDGLLAIKNGTPPKNIL